MTSISKKSDSIFVTDCLLTSPRFTRFEFWLFQFTDKDLKCLFSLLLYFSWNEGTDDDLYLNILPVCPTSFKEMLWPIKFINGARPGLKRQAQVISDSTQVTSDSATNAEKRFKYEQEKMPKRIFNAKWCEGRPCRGFKVFFYNRRYLKN